jgi:hypothetical protein
MRGRIDMRKRIEAGLLAAGLLFVMASNCYSIEFTATNVVHVPGMDKPAESKIYYSPNKQKEVAVIAGITNITILRYDLGVKWGIAIPDADTSALWQHYVAPKTYSEEKIPEELNKNIIHGVTGYIPEVIDLKKLGKKVGRGKIAGIMCDEYKLTTKINGENVASYYWVWSGQKIVLKVWVPAVGDTGQLKDIVVKALPASTFEPPTGYTKE